MFIEFNSNGDDTVDNDCAQCKGPVAVNSEVEEGFLFCDACIDRADPFIEYGMSIAWPGCWGYTVAVCEIADGYTQHIPEYSLCLSLAAYEVNSNYTYGHTDNNELNSMVSYAAVPSVLSNAHLITKLNN